MINVHISGILQYMLRELMYSCQNIYISVWLLVTNRHISFKSCLVYLFSLLLLLLTVFNPNIFNVFWYYYITYFDKHKPAVWYWKHSFVNRHLHFCFEQITEILYAYAWKLILIAFVYFILILKLYKFSYHNNNKPKFIKNLHFPP